jgi:cytidine deaminase
MRPYSRSLSGVALLTSNGRIFAGSYIENAAFNPSLPPLQAALAGYFAAGDKAGKIQRAVLAEGERAPSANTRQQNPLCRRSLHPHCWNVLPSAKRANPRPSSAFRKMPP